VPSQQINAISLVPPLVDPVRPDYDDIHAMVARMLAGEPAVAGEAAGSGDGSVGNEGSSAAAATQGSVPATPAAGTESATTQQQPTTEPAAGEPAATEPGATAQQLGLVCQPV
jgi:hypothetical protein